MGWLATATGATAVSEEVFSGWQRSCVGERSEARQDVIRDGEQGWEDRVETGKVTGGEGAPEPEGSAGIRCDIAFTL
jgi:hypothetical protein